MDILSISANEYLLNEDENLKHLLTPEVWNKIPLINVNEVHNFKDGTLVRFRGMIQDMYGPEYYLEKFCIFNNQTQENFLRNGKYTDGVSSGNCETIDLDSNQSVTGERHRYVVMSTPGINSWVQQYEVENFRKVNVPEVRPEPSVSCKKRNIDEVMEVEEDNNTEATNSSKKLSTVPQAEEEPKNDLVFSPEHILNHPLASEKSKVCHIKVYKDWEALKLNDVCDFLGFLSVDTVGENISDACDDFENQMEIQTHHPPSSLVPRIHVVHFKPLLHVNPLVKEDFSGNITCLATVKKDLLILLTQLLMGDALAAEYLVCNLISEIYLRRDLMPLGKFSLNISNVPKLENVDYVLELYKFLELLVPKSHYLPLTLENMNTLAFTPKKDYECNRLTSGVLQLSKNTLLVLDETKLQEGKLDAAGIQGVRTLSNAIKNQSISYDFGYYPLEYECDIPFLIFSEGKSMLPSDAHVPLSPDDDCVGTFSEILEAARHFLKPELMNEIRKYLTQARMIKYEISDQAQSLVQLEFVNMRQNGKMTAEDLHSLLVLARLICISEGMDSLDAGCWKKACEMENQRKARLNK